ncbi:MAG: methyltransferase domain-containing protein [Anaerolineae bacterium]|nr:methyltransferase domain-containing protein [Anaerolineae bacterium]
MNQEANIYIEGIPNTIRQDVPRYYQQVSSVDRRLLAGEPLAGRRILNVGSGRYLFSDVYFARRGASGTCLDLDPAEIAAARQRLAATRTAEGWDVPLSFTVGDGAQLPFGDATFDYAISFSAIEHIPAAADRRRAIREMARVLKAGGKLVITVPNRLNVPAGILARSWSRRMATYEYRYRPRELRDLLAASGLTVERFDAESLYLIDFPLVASRLPWLQKLPLSLFAPLSWGLRRLNSARWLKPLGMRMGFRAVKR